MERSRVGSRSFKWVLLASVVLGMIVMPAAQASDDLSSERKARKHQAEVLASAAVPGARLASTDLKLAHRRLVWRVKLRNRSGNGLTIVEVDAVTEKILTVRDGCPDR